MCIYRKTDSAARFSTKKVLNNKLIMNRLFTSRRQNSCCKIGKM